MGKCYILDVTRAHCEERARSRQIRRIHLQAILFECHNRLSAEREDCNISTRDCLCQTENELRALDRLDAAGARVRSCLRWPNEENSITTTTDEQTMTELHYKGNTYSETEEKFEKQQVPFMTFVFCILYLPTISRSTDRKP